MATHANSTPASARRLTPADFLPQLIVHGSVPPGCFGYLVDDDHSEPLLHQGDFAVIDTAVREPEAGALFLIEWNAGDREIVETYQRPCGSGGVEELLWWTGRFSRPRSPEELDRALRTGRACTVDGPYKERRYLAEKLIGKVVGVLAPDRHSRHELMRRRDVRSCPPHILATGYGRQPPGYEEPAGSAQYRSEAGSLVTQSRVIKGRRGGRS